MLDKFRYKLATALAPGMGQALTAGRLNYLITGRAVTVLPADSLTYMRAYVENDIIFAVQNWKAKKIGACPPVLFQVKDKKKFHRYLELRKKKDDPSAQRQAKELKEQALDPVDSHRILDIINKPNPKQNRAQFLYSLSTMYDVLGTTFVYGNRSSSAVNNGQIQELWRMQEYGMQVEGSGPMTMPTQFRCVYVKDPIPADKMLTLQRFNPLAEANSLFDWGMSLLEPLRLSVITKHQSANEAENESYQNRGPRKLIFPKEGATLDEFDLEQIQKVQDNLDKKLAKGSYNKVVANSVALDGIDIGSSLVDLNVNESYDTMLEKVCAVYGVRKETMASGKQSTFNNLTEARKYSLTDGVIPDLNLIYDKVYNGFLVSSFNTDKETFHVEPDLDFYHELQEDQKAKAEYLSMLPVTSNQLLEAFGYEPDANPLMNIPMIPSGRIPITDFAADPNQDDPTQNDGTYQDPKKKP
ncbi:phage portal protein [Spirosoma sp. HMF4905]|uniref:Phage portal protein n=1 Tax=Spirosoma arboris TaxID=2682092 RepID=A0A7K1SKR8_9BACT|nr:phage portal protein [Spirosoma arboris]MVM34407.1 phage portal protein [Spirosoma arboris]